jgi:hypothetical protein
MSQIRAAAQALVSTTENSGLQAMPGGRITGMGKLRLFFGGTGNLFRRFYQACERLRSPLRPVFHWQYSGWLIAILLPAGITMLLVDQYRYADIAFLFTGALFSGVWLCSDAVAAKKTRLGRREIRRDPERHRRGFRSYRLWEWIPVGFILFLTVVGFRSVESVRWYQESKDAVEKVVIEYSDRSDLDPVHTVFNVVNRSSLTLDKRHLLQCQFRHVSYENHNHVHSIWGYWSDREKHWWISGGEFPATEMVPSYFIYPNGDATSSNCLDAMGFAASSTCADIEVWFEYHLEDYPDRLLAKKIRLLGLHTKHGYEWQKKALDDPTDFCTT